MILLVTVHVLFFTIILEKHSSMTWSYLLQCVQYLVCNVFVNSLLLWQYILHIYHVKFNWMMYDAFFDYFYSFVLYHTLILSYLAENLYQIISIVKGSMFSSNFSSRFSTMFSYYSGSLYSIWVIICTLSIINPNFCNSPTNIYSWLIQYSGSLVISSN